jgi:hypothetical protein
MRAIRNTLLVILVLGAAVVGGYAYWDLEYRWRPHVIAKHQDEIAKILEASGWVSRGPAGLKLYLIAYRGCEDCARFEQSELPVLQGAGVDTRVIMIARADVNGQAKSTAAERSTVAELWVNRSWKLYEKWSAAPVDNWPAQAIAPADGDAARSAVVEAGRAVVSRLKPLLADNGIRPGYPILIWWAKDGRMEGCACQDPHTYRFVRRDLGAR